MILIGMYDSAFVRRVAVSLKVLGVAFEHRNWSIGADFDRIREHNPLGRVPTLVLDDGETLIDSAAILDWLDEQAGPQRALLPPSGADRRQALRLMAMASGAAEKGVLQIYEQVFRPADKRHEPWLARCRTQTLGTLDELEQACAARPAGGWLVGGRLSQADITVACVFTAMTEALKLDAARWPALRALSAQCEALPAFQQTRVPFHAPGS